MIKFEDMQLEKYIYPADPIVRNNGLESVLTGLRAKLNIYQQIKGPVHSILEVDGGMGYNAAILLNVFPEAKLLMLDRDDRRMGGHPQQYIKAQEMLNRHFPGRAKAKYMPKNDSFLTGPTDLVVLNNNFNALADMKRANKIAKWVVCPNTDQWDIRTTSQPLLVARKEYSWVTRGDVGDMLAGLATIKHFGPAHLYLLKSTKVRESMNPKKVYENLSPLLTKQPYITNVTYCEKEPEMAINLDIWRDGRDIKGSISGICARTFNIDSEPQQGWITCNEPQSVSEVIVARSGRYHANSQMYHKVMKEYLDKTFVGLPEEHQAFEAEFGKIPYHPTPNLYDLARVIAGCKIFVGNSSTPCWIALGVGVKKIINECHSPSCNCMMPGVIDGTKMDF